MAPSQDTAVRPEGQKTIKKNFTQDSLLRRQVDATKNLLEVTEWKVKEIEESDDIDIMAVRTNDIFWRSEGILSPEASDGAGKIS